MKEIKIRLVVSVLGFLLVMAWSPPTMGTTILPPPDPPLLEAVRKGDVEAVKSILKAMPVRRPANAQGQTGTEPETYFGGDELNGKGNYGDSPLTVAARNGNLAIVRLLVAHGAAIDGKPGDEDRTPLMAAADNGHVETVKYLVANGADINARRKGVTPLLVACDHFSIQFGPAGDKKATVLFLLESGADVNVQDASWLKSAMTPLMFAVVRGDAALVQAMLAKGAKTDLKNSKGDTALDLARKNGLDYIGQLLQAAASSPGGTAPTAKPLAKDLITAIEQGRIEQVKALVAKGLDVNARTAKGSTALMVAARANRQAIAQFLLDKGAEVNAKNGTNDTALIHAAAKGSVPVARVLLRAKADPNIANIDGGDALIYSILKKDPAMVDLLLDNGAALDRRYDEGKTALIMAIEQGQPAIAKTLIAKGADVNAGDENQKTALIHACEKRDAATVKALIAAGANPNAASKYGDMPLDTAIGEKHLVITRFLIENGADFKSTTALTSAVIAGSREIADLLIAKGADINERGADGKTPLIYAVAADTGIVRALVAKGADVNARDNEGQTAVLAAIKSFSPSKPQTVQFLLEKGADPNAADDKGETPLIAAARQGDVPLVRVLLENGCDVSAQDKQGQTAWSHAFQAGHGAVIKILETKGSPPSYAGVTWEGNSSNQVEAFIKVVTTPDEWAQLWTRAFAKPAPDVDFKHHAVACVFLGHSASWLYSIHLGQPQLRDNRMVISYVLVDVMLRLKGPFRAGGQYAMMVVKKSNDLEMVLENETEKMRRGMLDGEPSPSWPQPGKPGTGKPGSAYSE